MTIDSLRMPPFSTTLMGVLRGVLEHYGFRTSDALLYGASGHAFLMNIHDELCPSGPYCWKLGPFMELVKNLGVEMSDLGFFSRESDAASRAAIEARIKELLGRGVPCSLLNMEHQLITGWDESGFLTAQPWAPRLDFPPAREQTAIAFGLRHAADLYRRPSRHTDRPYAVGAGAWSAWIVAVEKGHGGGHGNWWNGTVWSECRSRASEFLAAIASSHPRVAADASRLAGEYRAIAGKLAAASDKALGSAEKVRLLREAGAREGASIPAIEGIAAALG